jgi:putative CocE/NonD family hydrolase
MRVRALAVCALAVVAALGPAARGEEKVSRPGEYKGYAQPVYDGWRLTSVYVPTRDGTKLAVDVIRPTQAGVVVKDRLPVLWMHSPYNRRPKGGKSQAETYPGGPIELVKYGYVVAVVDFRGLYASFGKDRLYNLGEYDTPSWNDAYDVTEWLARQPWSSGKVGMWGCSATGGSQLQAAATRPPSLKAIFPMSPNFDAYTFGNYGGAPSASPARPGKASDRDVQASPVDGPDGAALLAEAASQHVDDTAGQRELTFRDSRSAELGSGWWARSSPSAHLEALGAPGLAVYTAGNWDESSTKLAPAMLFANMPSGRAKLLFGPHGHCGWTQTASEEGFSIQIEELRFFDYWLKGVQNGIMQEPAVTYYTYNAPPGREWRQSDSWPLASQQPTRFYLRAGALSTQAPSGDIRDDTATGEPAAATSIQLHQADGGLAYETAPLASDLQVTGFPIADLWISADARDADVVAEIEDLAPDGTTRTHEMIGRLRASHRKLAKAPYRNAGLPYHADLSADLEPLAPGRPAELKFALLPMSYIFPRGHRIRVTVTFSDPEAPGRKAPASLWSGPATPSSIELPIIPG